MKGIIPFTTTYKWEKAFNTKSFMKNKYSMQSYSRPVVSNMEPDIKQIMNSNDRFNLLH